MNHESAFKYQIRPILKDSKHTPQHHQSTTKTQTTERVDPCWVWVSFLFPASLTDCRLLTDEGTKKKRWKCIDGVQVFLCGLTSRLKSPENTVFTYRHLMQTQTESLITETEVTMWCFREPINEILNWKHGLFKLTWSWCCVWVSRVNVTDLSTWLYHDVKWRSQVAHSPMHTYRRAEANHWLHWLLSDT